MRSGRRAWDGRQVMCRVSGLQETASPVAGSAKRVCARGVECMRVKADERRGKRRENGQSEAHLCASNVHLSRLRQDCNQIEAERALPAREGGETDETAKDF